MQLAAAPGSAAVKGIGVPLRLSFSTAKANHMLGHARVGRRVVAIGALLAVSTAWAGTIRDDLTYTDYNTLLTDPVLAPAINSVGEVIEYTTGGNYLNSGTLVSSRWVLTAAHSVYEPGYTTTAENFILNGTTYTASQWIKYPTYTGSFGTQPDLALVLITAPITSVAPATRFTGSDERGLVGTSVGYGMTGNGFTGSINGTQGTKHVGQNTLDVWGGVAGYSNDYVMTDFDSPGGSTNKYGSATALPLEYCVAPGDSGGGTFVTVNGQAQLAAVTSFGLPGNNGATSSYGATVGLVRVARFNSWINDTIACNWTNTSGGPFNTASNWNYGYTPDTTDLVTFRTTGTYTLSLSNDTTTSSVVARYGTVTLDLTGHTYTANANNTERSLVLGKTAGEYTSLTILNGTFSAYDGAIAEGTGTTANLIVTNAKLNYSGPLTIGGSATASGGSGTLTLNAGGTAQVTGPLTIYSTGKIVLNGGNFTLASGGTSAGTINASGGGTFLVSASTLSFTGGTLLGNISVNSGANVTFNSGTTYIGGVSITGNGTVNLNGGTLSATSAASLGNLVMATGTSITGTGTLTLTGSSSWSGGLMTTTSTGLSLVAANASLTLTGTSTKALGNYSFGRNFQNDGTVYWQDTGSFNFGKNSIFTNSPNALFEIRGDASLGYASVSGTPTINNAGTLRKTASTGTTYISSYLTLNNTGTIDVQSGTLSISAAVTQLSSNTLTGGTWIVRDNANLTLGSATITTNQANITLDGPASTFAAINSLNNNQGSFTLTGQRNFTTAGALTNSGTLTANTNSKLTVTGLLTANGGTLDGPGTITANAGLTVTNNTQRTNAGLLKIANGPLTIASGKSLDLTNSTLLFQSSATSLDTDYAALWNLLSTGRNGGLANLWSGPGIISSTIDHPAKPSGTELHTLALVKNSDLETPHTDEGANAYSLYVQTALAGDTNLDGLITMDDYLTLDTSFLFGLSGAASFMQGDFNYDGQITAADYALIDNAYQQQIGPAAEDMISLHAAWFGASYLDLIDTNVPEPASLTLLLLATPALLRRRNAHQ